METVIRLAAWSTSSGHTVQAIWRRTLRGGPQSKVSCSLTRRGVVHPTAISSGIYYCPMAASLQDAITAGGIEISLPIDCRGGGRIAEALEELSGGAPGTFIDIDFTQEAEQ